MSGEKGCTDCVDNGFWQIALLSSVAWDLQKDSIVIVVSLLNALIRDQLQKLKGCVNVCVLNKKILEDEGEQKVTVTKDVNNCSLLLGHPEVFVDNKTVAKMSKGEEFQRRARAIVIDEAHLVLQWCLYILFKKLF